MKPNEQLVNEVLQRGVEEVIDKEHLRGSLLAGKKLRIKFGIDPTSPNLHLGHAVVLRKLKQFQELGHKIVFVIGDYTARIGDPTGVSKTRQELTQKEVERNMKHYVLQAQKILDFKKVEVCWNSRWLRKLEGKKMFELLSMVSVNQMLERDDFGQRISNHRSVRIHEFLYPILQGYDSVVLKTDIEVGGKDQLLNMLMGRTLMEKFNLKPQDILTVGLLEGTDGVRKMSKSYGNDIAFGEKPNDMFGKIMSVPDNLVHKYFELLTDIKPESLKKISSFEQKKKLAGAVVLFIHSKKDADVARDYFEKVFSKKEIPEDLEIIEAATGEKWTDILVRAKLSSSKSEASRLIKGGGLSLDGVKIARPDEIVLAGGVLKIGKHKFIRLKFK
ncbi:tyrosine--tRNA ligase [Candidatus Giovannonibacteria bacterium]|nr:tyrosine--tRNA ligase [Candidatus Giovannonibacteria bacterium]